MHATAALTTLKHVHSYNAENGHPSCANDYILNKVMRGMWSKDALVTTDWFVP